jgi:hypothetical protein
VLLLILQNNYKLKCFNYVMAEFDALQEVVNTAETIDPAGTGLTSIAQNLPPEVIAKLGSLIFLFKTLGVIFIIYLIFLLVKGIFSIKTGIRIKKMAEQIDEIEEKLNKALKVKGVKVEKRDVKVEKDGDGDKDGVDKNGVGRREKNKKKK